MFSLQPVSRAVARPASTLVAPLRSQQLALQSTTARSFQTTAPCCNWQIYLRQRRDEASGKLKYDDWDRVIMSMKEPRLADGTSLLRRSLARTRHVKPTTKNKLINQRKQYRRQIKRIDDLTNYIQFMNDVKKK